MPKGQIQIVFLLLIVIAIVFLTQGKLNFSDLKELFFPFPSTRSPASSPPTLSRPLILPYSPAEKPAEEPKKEEPKIESPDTTPPKRFNPQPTGELAAQTRRVAMSLETDEKAVCKYSDVSGVYYEQMQNAFSNTGATSHSVLITTLSEGEEYKYYVRCSDDKGNKNTDDFVIPFGVKEAEDITPPFRRNQYPTGEVLPAGTKETVIGVSTDEVATCRYSTEAGVSYDSMRGDLTDDGTGRYHTATIGNLEDHKIYNFFVRCQDSAGNANTGDTLIYFSVGAE